MSGQNSQKQLHKDVKTQINKHRRVDDDKELFIKFKKGLEWKDENLVKHCAGCSTRFTMVTRKHHCRECGDVFCNSCSSYKIVVQGALKRCCTTCYRRAVVESNQAMTGNHINMDYDYPVSAGEGSFASNRSASFAKAVHLVESFRETPSSGRKNTSGRSAVGTQSSTLTEMPPSNSKESKRWKIYLLGSTHSSMWLWRLRRRHFMEGDVDQVERRVELYPPRSLPPNMVQDIVNAAIPDEDACRAALSCFWFHFRHMDGGRGRRWGCLWILEEVMTFHVSP